MSLWFARPKNRGQSDAVAYLGDCRALAPALLAFGLGCSADNAPPDIEDSFDFGVRDVVADTGSPAADAALDAGADIDTGALADAEVDAGAAADAQVDVDAGTPAVSTYFPAGSFFYEDVSAAPKAADSDAIIAALIAAGGWGNGNRFQIDFSIDVLQATAATPKQSFVPTGDHFSPDCDTTPVPIVPGGNLEGEDGYACTSDGDCHLIVYAPEEERLYEMWRADIDANGTFNGGCLATWDTSIVYPETGRGDQCTSADAAGFPIAPLLFTADEVAAGQINHAIRFILPNNRVRARRYVRPATHGTNTTGAADAPQYGVHFRLRADYPLNTLPNDGARVVARALQRYGMYHADGGNIALTAQSDRRTVAKWDGLLGPRDLAALQVSDFEVIYHSDDIEVTFDCRRVPLTQ